MELTRRFIFNGSAAAFGGRFVRPEDVVLASQRRQRAVGRRRPFGVARPRHQDRQVVPYRPRRDLGLGPDGQPARRHQGHARQADCRSAHGDHHGQRTRARPGSRRRGSAEEGRRARAADDASPDVAATLVSRSARPGHESSVIVGDASIGTVTFDSPVHGRYKLDVVIDIAPFRKCDTRAKVVADSSILQVHGDRDLIFATIVKELVWQKGRAYPGSEAARHQRRLHPESRPLLLRRAADPGQHAPPDDDPDGAGIADRRRWCRR